MRFALASLLVFSVCDRSAAVAAQPPDDEQSPAVWLEAGAPTGPLTAGPSGPGRPIADAERRDLAACWFAHPYEYMFKIDPGRGPLEILGNDYGMFSGGIGGIMHYGSLSECAGEIAGTEQRGYSDDEPMAALAGLPLHSDRMNQTQPFGFFNPELIRWGHHNLIPDPQSRPVEGILAAELYTRVFRRFFRLMTESYVDLRTGTTWENDQNDYWHMATTKKHVGYDGIEWLEGRYSGRLPHHARAWDGTDMTVPMAYGFWLRRGLDGTHEEVWTGLSKLMTRFDRDYWSGLADRHASAPMPWTVPRTTR